MEGVARTCNQRPISHFLCLCMLAAQRWELMVDTLRSPIGVCNIPRVLNRTLYGHKAMAWPLSHPFDFMRSTVVSQHLLIFCE